MKRRSIPKRGDVFWLDPNPVSGREMKNRHRFIVISPNEINTFGVCMVVPVISGGKFASTMGLTVPISGYDTKGVVVCNQIRSFDIEERVSAGSAKYIETIDSSLVDDIVDHVVSILDPLD